MLRHFRRIHENDALFPKMCVFRWNLVIFLENLQILPMVNVTSFSQISQKWRPFFENVFFFAQNSQKTSIFCRNEQGTPAKIGVGHFILDNLSHAYHGRITYPYCAYHSLTKNV